MNTLAEAGKYLSVGRGAVYVALKKNRLKAIKNGNRWTFNAQDLDEYKRNKFSRKFSTFKGQPLFDKEKGEYSATEAAKILGCPLQHIYHACRTNKIMTSKKRATWVINEIDIIEYRKKMKIGKSPVK